MSVSDRRRAPRVPLKVAVSVEAGNLECGDFETMDLSEGGVFLSGAVSAGVGDVVSLRVNGLLRDKAVPVTAQVVRRTGSGLALSFV